MSDSSNATKLTMADQADRHALYQKSVQAPEAEVEFFEKTYRAIRNKDPLSLKEDFCGTAYLSAEWCKSAPNRTAIGVDLDKETLDWGQKNNIDVEGEEFASRIELIQDDVRNVTEPQVDIVCAFNFSYCLFEKRDELRHYFEQARKSLKDDGIMVVDLFGGTECYEEIEEESEIEDEPATYIWDQHSFNPIDNHMQCYIHYEFDDGSRLEKAFSYAWRLYGIPEIKEIFEEAGYSKVRVYWERFEESDDDDDELEGTGEYYETTEVENQESWNTYIVAEK